MAVLLCISRQRSRDAATFGSRILDSRFLTNRLDHVQRILQISYDDHFNCRSLDFTCFVKISKQFVLLLQAYVSLFILSCLSWVYYAGTALSVLGNFSISIICILCIYR